MIKNLNDIENYYKERYVKINKLKLKERIDKIEKAGYKIEVDKINGVYHIYDKDNKIVKNKYDFWLTLTDFIIEKQL